MKLGFDNKRETAWMIGLVVVAVVAGTWSYLRPSPATQAAQSNSKAATNPVARPSLRGGIQRRQFLKNLAPSLDPSIRFDLLKSSEGKAYEGGKRNIFREYAEEVKIEAPKAPVIVEQKPQPPVYTPPPIPLKYYGFASKPGEPRKIFLSNGDEVFVAEEGQIIQRRYKVGRITPSTVEVEDVLNNNKQTIPLTQG